MKHIRLLALALLASLASVSCSDDEPAAPKIYQVGISTSGHGTATATPDKAEAGTTITLAATAEEGYEFASWAVESGDAQLASTTDNPSAFVMPEGDVKIRASFVEIAAETYAVTVVASEGGKAEADPAEAAEGVVVTLTATPDEGYRFDGWSVDEGGVELKDDAAASTTFTMGAAAVKVSARFAAVPTYAVTVAETIEHGKVEVAIEGGAEKAAEGARVTLTATPDEGYEFRGWSIEGVEIEDLKANPLEFEMPACEVKVNAEFAEPINVLDQIADPTFKAYATYRMENKETGTIDGKQATHAPWDKNLDGVLSEEEAAEVKLIDLNTFYNETQWDLELDDELAPVTSLAGIEYFTGLQKLDISDYIVDTDNLEIDLTANRALVEFSAEDCGYAFTKLTLGDKPELKTLNLDLCWDLAEVDLTACPKLETLILTSDYVTQIDLAKCPALRRVELSAEIDEIDLSGCTELTTLYLNCGSLAQLDIARNTKLNSISCTRCALTALDITKMAFKEDGTYTAYVGSQGSRKNPLTLELKMRADQKKHWDEVLTQGTDNASRNERVNATVAE